MLTKVLPPPVPQGLLERTRLTQLLEDPERSVVEVVAAAGYGKTWLLASWAAQTKLPVAWYSPDERDRDLTTFLTYLSHALARVIPNLAAYTDRLKPGEVFKETGFIESLIVSEILSWEKPVVLVIDDFHYIAESTDVCDYMERFLRHQPANLRLVLASRRHSEIPAIHRLDLEGRLQCIDETNMRFNALEIAAIFQSAEIRPTAATEQLIHRAEGWPVAISMAARPQQSRSGQPFLTDWEQSSDTRALFNYLASNVLISLEPSKQQFLLRSAILEKFSSDLCNAVLELHDAQAMLMNLEHEHLFITCADAAGNWYRYHPLFREFLLRKLNEIGGKEQLLTLNHRAADWFLAHDDKELALDYFLSAEDFCAAAEVFHSVLMDFLNTNRYHRLDGWLTRFPAKFIEQNPWLLLTKARLLAYSGNLQVAEIPYRQAEVLFRRQGDNDGLRALLVDRGNNLYNQAGDNLTAEAVYREALDLASNDGDRAVILGCLARCRYKLSGYTPEVQALLDESVILSRNVENLTTRANALKLRAYIYALTGQYALALADYAIARDLLERVGNQYQLLTLLVNSALMHKALGDLESAESLVRRALGITTQLRLGHEHFFALITLGTVLGVKGDLDEAQRYIEESINLARQLGSDPETAAGLSELGEVLLRKGNLNEAFRWGSEAVRLREKVGDQFELGRTLIPIGMMHLEAGQLAEADEVLTRSLMLLSPSNSRYEQTQLSFFKAVIAQRRGQPDIMLSHLEQAMSRAHTFEHSGGRRCLNFFIEEAKYTAPLMADAMQWNAAIECVDCLLPRLGQHAIDSLLPLLDNLKPELRQRACKLLGETGHPRVLSAVADLRDDPHPAVRDAALSAIEKLLSIPPAPLRVYTLGGFRLFQGEREITSWPRYSARDLFLMLLDARGRPINSDVLIESLWPDAPADKARQSLRRAAADLRRTLEPDLPAGFPSRYLVTGDEMYTLQLPEASWVDAVEFQRALDPPDLRGVSTSQGRSSAIESLEKTLGLYKGDYLPEAPYQDWALAQREHLKELFLQGLNRLAGLQFQQTDYPAALKTARRAVQADPWDEEAVLIVMKACQSLGDIPSALEAYLALKDRLQSDLGLPPRDDLTALHLALRSRKA